MASRLEDDDDEDRGYASVSGQSPRRRSSCASTACKRAVRRSNHGPLSLRSVASAAVTLHFTMILWLIVGTWCFFCCDGHSRSGATSSNIERGGYDRGRFFFGKPVDPTDDDDNNDFSSSARGTGREVGFDLFQGRGGSDDRTRSTASSSPNYEHLSPRRKLPPRSGASRPISSSTRRRATSRSSSFSSSTSSSSSASAFSDDFATFWADRLDAFRTWLSEHNLPKIQCRVEPVSTLKIRKQFRPLKTIVTLGADFNLQLGIWRFKSSWEDSLIGGKLTLAGRELNFSKTFFVSLGGVEDLVARLKLRCAIDLATMRMYARFGCRTERISPLNIVDGFTISKQLPLDGTNGHVKLEVRANFAFPEPEIEFSTQGLSGSSFVSGMGDIEVNIDELNLLLHY